MEEKRHYKLYKSGKNWVVASIAAITVLSGSGLAGTALNVHAATPAAAQSNINFNGLKSQLVWSNAKAANASIYSSATGKTLVAKLQADIKTANGYINNPKSATQAKVNTITTALRNDGVNLNNEVANILNGQLYWSNKKVASDYVTAQGKTLFAQLQKQLATANSYVKNPSLATPENVMAITSALHQTGLDLYASKVTDLKAQLVWSNAKKAADYTTEAGKKAFATLTADIKIANGYVADPEFATPDQIATITTKLHQDGLDLIASNAAGDATQLNKDITTAAALVATDYTKYSFATFTTALDAAKKVAADKTANQAAIDAADKALTDASNALVANPVDATALQTLVNSAPTTNDDVTATSGHKYTSVSYASFPDALKAAKAVLANTKATQSQIDAATTALKTAIDGLKSVATGKYDDSQLKLDIASASALYYATGASTKYSDNAYTALGAALRAANAAYKADGTFSDTVTGQKVDGTKVTIDGLDNALAAAIKNIDAQATVNKDKLNAAIAAVSNTLNNTGKAISMTNKDADGNQIFTTASFNAFVTAYNAAQTVAASTTATTNDVEKALDNLTAAIGYTTDHKAKDDKSGLQPFAVSTNLTADVKVAQNKLAYANGNKTVGGQHIYTQASYDALNTLITKLANKASDSYAYSNITAYTIDTNVSNDKLVAIDKAVVDATNGLVAVPVGTLDKTGLQATLAQVASIVKSNNKTANGAVLYKTSLYQAFMDAVNQANTDLASMTTTQKDIDGDADAVNNTAVVLEAPTLTNGLDISAATAAKAAKDSLEEKDYTADSWKAVTTATETLANDLKPGAKVSQATLDADTASLNSAIKGLISNADKTDLAAEIKIAQAADASAYSVDSYATLTEKLNAAVSVNNDKSATKIAVEGAYTALKTAVDKLASAKDQGISTVSVKTVNDALTTVANATNATNATPAAKDPKTYTTATWNNFATALTNAKAEFATAPSSAVTIATTLKTGVTAAAANAVIAKLQVAMDALTFQGSIDAMTQLEADVTSASKLKASDYTGASFAKLTEAIKAANNTINGVSGAASVDKASAALAQAVQTLVPVSKSNLATQLLAAEQIAGGKAIAPTSTATPADKLTIRSYNLALENAKKVNADAAATQAQISSAATELKAQIEAISGLNDYAASEQSYKVQFKVFGEDALTASDVVTNATADYTDITGAYGTSFNTDSLHFKPAYQLDGEHTATTIDASGIVTVYVTEVAKTDTAFTYKGMVTGAQPLTAPTTFSSQPGTTETLQAPTGYTFDAPTNKTDYTVSSNKTEITVNALNASGTMNLNLVPNDETISVVYKQNGKSDVAGTLTAPFGTVIALADTAKFTGLVGTSIASFGSDAKNTYQITTDATGTQNLGVIVNVLGQ